MQNQELLGHFHKRRGQMVSVVRMKLPTAGHGLESCWLPHRRAGQCFHQCWLGLSRSLRSYNSNLYQKHRVKSCQFPVSCETQYKALNFSDDWFINMKRGMTDKMSSQNYCQFKQDIYCLNIANSV